MRSSLIVAVVCATFGLTALACSSDEGGGGSSGSSGSAGSGTGGTGGSGGSATGCSGAPTECCSETPPVMQVEEGDALVDADWSCLSGGTGGAAGAAGGAGAAGAAGGAGAAGAAGAAGNANQNKFEVEDFISNQGVADIEVELYEGESIVGKTPFFTDFTKGVSHHADDASLNVGEFWFPHPFAPLLSYRVKEKANIAKEFVGFGDEVPEPPGRIVGSTLSPASYQQLASFAVPIAGWSPPADLGIVVGPIRDCQGRDVGGAQIKFFDEQTGQQIAAGEGERDVRYIYFDSSYPNDKCNHTDHRQSLWVIANAPANAAGDGLGKQYRVEYWGRLSASQSDPVKFAEKQLEIFANAVNVHQIRPNVQQ